MYLEYKRRVERANLGDTVKYQLVSMSQLVEMPVQKMLARPFFSRGSITQQPLETAIETHAGHEEAEDDSLGCLSEREADARLAEVPPRQRVAGENRVMPSEGVALGDSVDVPVPPLVPLHKRLKQER